jgi:hypothetical protein
MNTNEILEAIDQEILKLQQARALLADAPAVQAGKPATGKPATGKRRGRPKGSVNKKAEVIAPVTVNKVGRVMSAEGKARIAAAQKARWAKQKKTSKTAAKKIAPKPAKKAVPAAKPAAKKIASKISKKRAVPAKKSVAAAPPTPAAES